MKGKGTTRACDPQTCITVQILLISVCLVLLVFVQSSLAAPPAQGEPKPQTFSVYLPAVLRSTGSGLPGHAIWAAGPIQNGSVALFRRRFDLPSGAVEAALDVFADTRYEVWLDGEWLGRGPARFGLKRQEFDTYALGPLAPGAHQLAILVQYAPNTRRSVDLGGGLHAGLRERVDGAWRTLLATDERWRALVSPAWDAEAGPVHRGSLIGPMELLDLRRLPQEWPQLKYDDRSWPAARALVDGSGGDPFPALLPRTIPPLVETIRLPVRVVESGWISPQRRILEWEHPQGTSAPAWTSLTLTALAPTTLRLEAIENGALEIDGQRLTWRALDEPRRPDLVVAEGLVAAGTHVLRVEVPPQGRSLAIDTREIALHDPHPRIQTHDPGRRTLLGDPAPDVTNAFSIFLAAGGAEIEVPAGDTPRYVVLDFGQTIHARLDVLAKGQAGTIIDAGWDERLTGGRALPAPGSLMNGAWSQVDSWVLDGTPRRLTTLDARAGRYLTLQIYGPGSVRLSGLHARREAYPVLPAGEFSSSDPLLDEIWQTGVDSLIPNMTDAYTDTPWRERGQWWGDAFVSFAVNRAAFGDQKLLRRGLRQMADDIDLDGRPAPFVPRQDDGMLLDYGMLWIESLYTGWQLGGDLDLVRELYPDLLRLLSFIETYESPNGLLDLPRAHWSQSALIDWPAVTSRSGESTALNALYAANLQQAGEMLLALGRQQEGQRALDKSQSVIATMQRRLFLPERGCYAATRHALEDGGLLAPSPHAQAWALCYGVVPTEHRQAVADCLLAQLEPFFDAEGWPAVEIYGMLWTLDALAYADRTTPALDLIREQYGRLLERGATTWWELFTPNQDRGHSLSHAWGGAPTWFLSTHVLGGQVLGPQSWRIAPHPGDLAWARGAVPIAASSGEPVRIEIDWTAQCGAFQLTFQAPEETQGEVRLPVPKHARVTLDGALVWEGGPGGGDHASGRSVRRTPESVSIAARGGAPHFLDASWTCQVQPIRERPFLP
jgi:alpha-L-rhamnosidase